MSAKVYIVDDDASVRDALAMLLEIAGHEVESFANAEAFLAAYRPGYQGCIILDVHMPVMDGPALQEELLNRGIRMPIIFLSAFSNIPVTVRTIKAGAIDFLTKPVDGSLFLQRVQDALNRNAQVQEEALVTKSFAERISGLTKREREIMVLAVSGQTSKKIARCLNISYRTVEAHRAHIMQKTGASSLLELARFVDDAKDLGILAD